MSLDVTKNKENIGMWIVVEIADDRILQCLNYTDQPKENAVTCAVELAMENGYEYGRSDAADTLNDEGRLFVGDWEVHLAFAE